ncbi:uncharacterized protein Z518_00449 [Rhinocladiella mackenziei CBS 650.93]|uniref:Major facilitator superfamily (MFS) profile domain-containing protein n=1 Tax=Rhinocladiella mackenziei CBS 650.93 TaxID=1442369 RepID=A0A0D2JIX7_9EURO|nr:uncharacterized protein Z518_00449 [Rhinocladiella mackenziei CBS 650.93]KIX09370.1 hypothetical protein Z518_00449 [Rhinocladiella mackenziei CBS 650.93]
MPPEPKEEQGHEEQPPKPPGVTYPEGGTKAWLNVLGTWCVMFFTWGYLNAFGVYEAYYLHDFLGSYSPSTIAWIGSLQLFFQFAGGVVAGPVTDRWGARILIWPFSILYVVSVMLTSICKKYWQFILVQGALGGLANGLVFAPAVAVLGQYFQRRRAVALGIASSGSSLGGVIFPVMLDLMIFHTPLGFGWAVRIVGFLVLGLVLTACVTIIPRLPPRKGKYLLIHAFKNPIYSIQVAGLFLVWLGLFTPFFYLPSYSESKGLSFDLALTTIAILNAGSLVGRLSSEPLAKHLGRFNLLLMGICACGILVFCWLRVSSIGAICAFAALYGAASGFVIALFPTTLADVAPHPSEIGSYVGMALGLYGIAGLTGTPITGAMIAHYGGYSEATIFSGCVVMAGTALLLYARLIFVIDRGWKV